MCASLVAGFRRQATAQAVSAGTDRGLLSACPALRTKLGHPPPSSIVRCSLFGWGSAVIDTRMLRRSVLCFVRQHLGRGDIDGRKKLALRASRTDLDSRAS